MECLNTSLSHSIFMSGIKRESETIISFNYTDFGVKYINYCKNEAFVTQGNKRAEIKTRQL